VLHNAPRRVVYAFLAMVVIVLGVFLAVPFIRQTTTQGQNVQQKAATGTPPATKGQATRPASQLFAASDIQIQTSVEGTSNFLPGATFTQDDQNLSDPTEIKKMSEGLGYLNVFIYGWGTDNPEPQPGRYDWSTLDQRVDIMRQANVTKIISLCCAPDWMKQDTNIDSAPTPDHYQDFADLAKQVARRYPDVKYFQVWNELKGFLGNKQGYMDMYNLVYNAVKSVRPDAIVGGPYVGIGPKIFQYPQNIVTQWLANKAGGEFVVVDGGYNSSSAQADFDNARFYTDFGKWLRSQPGWDKLPFGWAEWYPGTVRAWNDENHFNATMTNAMIQTIRGGASYALMWGVEGGISGAYQEGDGQQEGLIDPSGPQPRTTPWYDSVKMLKDHFGPGTQLLQVTQKINDVTVLASRESTLLVNHLSTPLTVTVNDRKVSLNPYEVKLIDTPSLS
jgi:hypothetical protein